LEVSLSIDSIGVDLDHVLSLDKWLENASVLTVQRQLEEKITQILFSQDPSSPAFQQMAEFFAQVGSRNLSGRGVVTIEPCGLFKEIGKFGKSIGEVGKSVGNFVVDHAVEIAVGVAICATGVGIAVVTGYTVSAVVGGVVVAGAGSIFQSEEQPNPPIPPIPLPDPQACSQAELIAIKQGISTTLPKINLPSSTHEILITANGIWANGEFFSTDGLMAHPTFQEITPETSIGFQGNDWKTFHAYQFLLQEGQLSDQIRGENALILGNYQQAISDLDKAIETNPTDSLSYLERGAAYFALNEYDRSLEDYQQFASQEPPSGSKFCVGFTKGLPKGAYESGKAMLFFLADFINDPIHTAKLTIDSITTLVDLVAKDEWGELIEALSPEAYQLVAEWHTLSSDERGELAGFALGKLGGDILIPGALGKVASKSLKTAEELVAVCKNLQIAQEALILETAAGIGNGAKITEVIEVGQKTITLGEELGFTAREMGQLKQAGKVEEFIANNKERIANNPALRESEKLFERAQDFLEIHTKKFMPEGKCRELIHEAGVPTFPRPVGIPEAFSVQITDKGAGMIYLSPGNTHTYVKVMPGKPHSPFPQQHKPYVVQMKDGQAFDKFGNKVSKNAPEAHIPLDEFFYRD
jgi:tetratricopeptide (TPR) repeat protein